MAVTNSSANKLKPFLDQLRSDFRELKFCPGAHDHWSPSTNTITYKTNVPLLEQKYSILHELAHARLGHTNYHNDFELLKLEAQAWELAAKLGRKYKVKIVVDHIQNCLDTYRDWLHARSACPNCHINVLQKDPFHYHCFNCSTEWRVTSGHFVRPYRRKVAQ